MKSVNNKITSDSNVWAEIYSTLPFSVLDSMRPARNEVSQIRISIQDQVKVGVTGEKGNEK